MSFRVHANGVPLPGVFTTLTRAQEVAAELDRYFPTVRHTIHSMPRG